jgi:hypothetical protein
MSHLAISAYNSYMADTDETLDEWFPYPIPGYRGLEISNRGEYRCRNHDGTFDYVQISLVSPLEIDT